MDKLLLGIFVGLGAIAVIAIVGIIAAIPVYFLWNWLMPTIFDLVEITFWQAWGLFFLAGLLTKGSSSTASSKCITHKQSRRTYLDR